MSNVPNHLSVSNIRISSFDSTFRTSFSYYVGPVGRFLEDDGPVNQRWWLHDSLDDCVRRCLPFLDLLCPPHAGALPTGEIYR